MQRLYLQYRPDDQTFQQLLELQSRLYRADSGQRIVVSNQLHLTLVHFGILQDVFSGLQTVIPKLDYEHYRQQVENFVVTSEAVMPPTLSLVPTGLELFGSNKSTLVVRLRADSMVDRAHRAALLALQTCLRQCGVDNVDAYMAADRNFQYALTFKPHLSLLKNVDVLPDVRLLPNTLQFEALPTRYD